jgi:photosystem II stability/assembly factor-like uncharacterized protein
MKVSLTILLISLLATYQGQPSSSFEKPIWDVKSAPSSQKVRTMDTTSGIIYFSLDNGATWFNQSKGLPENIVLTDMAAAGDLLGITTKEHGIFLFDAASNSWAGITANPPTTDNLNTLYFHLSKLFVGTGRSGVFATADGGKTWTEPNKGLLNLTIRKLAVIDKKLYAGTNSGLYILNELDSTWALAFDKSSLQVNGITGFDGDIYIGTNQGAFKAGKGQNIWKQIMPGRSLHNISSDERSVYALTYNELFASMDKGATWKSIQKGLPEGLYSFQLLQKDNVVLVGQWDGVYKRDRSEAWLPINKEWTLLSNGLPEKFSVTEMKIYKNMIVIGCSERKLRKGVRIIK